MLTRLAAQTLMHLVPERGLAVITLNNDFAATPIPGTISGSGSTITGVGTAFLTGPMPIAIGNTIIANGVSGPLNFISSGTNIISGGMTLTVTAVNSDTSLTVAQSGLSFSGAPLFLNENVVINSPNSWVKPISSKLAQYGGFNMQNDSTLIKVPDAELNPKNNGYEIRQRDKITFGGRNFVVMSSTLKTVRTVWECLCSNAD